MNKIHLHDAAATMDEHRRLIQSTQIDLRFLNGDQLAVRSYVAQQLTGSKFILDVGRCLREQYDKLNVQAKETLDINDFGDYPDIIGDFCQPFPIQYKEKYDALAILSILEHVYDPFSAVDNIKYILEPGGKAFVLVPYMYRYHARKDLLFADYYRFSRDGLCYMFRDFSKVTLFPIRGKYAAIANFLKPWRYVEKYVGFKANSWLNKLDSEYKNTVQSSFYLVEIIK